MPTAILDHILFSLIQDSESIQLADDDSMIVRGSVESVGKGTLEEPMDVGVGDVIWAYRRHAIEIPILKKYIIRQRDVLLVER